MERERKEYISFLNIIACYSVVLMHCNGSFWTKTVGADWWFANFIETTCYFAVPVFFMLTGVTLLDYPERYSTKIYFIKRLKKAFIPFLVWSTISYGYQYCISMRHGEIMNEKPLQVIDNIVNARYMSVYWFFIPLFSIYLAIPVLAKIKDKESVFIYASIIGFLFNSVLPLVLNLMGLSMNTTWVPGTVSGQLFLPMLGYVLAKKDFQRKQRVIVYVAGVCGWILHFAGTAIVSTGSEINTIFKGDYNLPAVLWASAVFVFVKHNVNKKNKIVDWFAKRTFGIYLIHMYLIIICSKVLCINLDLPVMKIVCGTGIFVVGAGIILGMQKIAVVREVVQ